MSELVLDAEETVSGGDSVYEESVLSDSEFSEDGLESDISDSASDGLSAVFPDLVYDEELGGYPVVIVNDVSDAEVSLFSLPDGVVGYQVSDYWLNYFRGVLQKHLLDDYLVFATRESTVSGYNNYITHYWMYVGDLENGGDITVYDCYAESSVYYVDVSVENMGAIDVDSYGTLVYSNLGHASDIREGDGYVPTLAMLFFLGFFTVYAVCHGFFDFIVKRIYRK